MKHHHTLILSCALLALTGPLAAQSQPPAASSLTQALSAGKFSLDERLRWEDADQASLRDSNAFTLRSEFGYTSAPLDGFSGMLEGINVAELGNPGNYNAAGSNPSGKGRTVIADPRTTQMNQAWLQYADPFFTVKGGRQRIVLDNARFVGDVNWRQDMQTYDAATADVKPATGFDLYYGYLWYVKRVFADIPQNPDFKSKSNLINLSYSGWSFGKLTAYAYLLDFTNSAANSSDTYGASFAGAAPVVPGLKVTYRIEGATQSDAANNPVNYTARYWDGELGGATKQFTLLGGYEVLGSDDGRKGFATPLATLHAFNGWADLFLTTPANGLRDLYVSGGVVLPGAFPVTVVYHKFESDVGDLSYGHEWDGVITHKFTKQWSVLAKFARYYAGGPYLATKKIWLQTEFMY